MHLFDQLEDDYKHMSQWHRDLLRDVAKDFRKQSAASATQTVRPALSLVPIPQLVAVSTPDQLVGHAVQGALPGGPAKTVRGK